MLLSGVALLVVGVALLVVGVALLVVGVVGVLDLDFVISAPSFLGIFCRRSCLGGPMFCLRSGTGFGFATLA